VPRVRRPARASADPAAPPNGAEPFEPHDVTGLFATPTWLRELGTTAWLAVGIVLMVVGGVLLLALTSTIVMPLLAATVVAAVCAPVVDAAARRRIGRGGAAALVLVGGILAAVGVTFLVVRGITGQLDGLRANLAGAKDTIAGWLRDLGVDAGTARRATDDAGQTGGTAVSSLLAGVAHSLQGLSSLAVFLSLTALSLFFLLKDGPTIRAWGERHMRVPPPVAHGITGRVLSSLRAYFFGVTIVACFNAALVLAGALILGVPLAGTIAIITFLGAYVPYLGAWGAGAFAVLIALGGAGTDAAIGMAVIQLLANGVLQQMIQPIAYGAALGIHPLAVLVVTIAGGALFGAVGLILAAPLTAATARIAADLAAGTDPAGEPARPAAP
jgi:predicted PurR-regulated permease PerM